MIENNNIKKTLTILLLMMTVSLCWSNSTVYVSPNGDDAIGKGTKSSPFQSIDMALKKGLSSNIISDTLYIIVVEGEYYMKKPITIDKTLSQPVVIKSEGIVKPQLLGGVRVKNWEKYGDKLYRAYIPEVIQYGLAIEQFYVDGKRATLAKTPNSDWFYVKGSKEHVLVKGIRAADFATQQIKFEQEDWATLKNLTTKELASLKFRFYHKWDITQKQAEYVDTDSSYIYIAGEGIKPWNQITKSSRYIMYDYFKALDNPGEWYLDKENGYVYYMPKENEDMNTAHCIVPTIKQWIVFEGNESAPITNITIDNISFQYTSYNMPRHGEDPVQSAAHAEASMRFDFCNNIKLVNCELMHTGAYGIWFRQECHNNTIEHCYITDLGAGGIKIGEPYFRNNSRAITSYNTINNNIITNAGHELPCGAGVALFLTSDNKVTHNEISDLRYSGISIGWVWGYNNNSELWTSTVNSKGDIVPYQNRIVNPAVRNIIEYNHIHHIGWGELSDMGAVYTLGESQGTKVSHNVIHDVLSYDYGGWGLYTDEGSAGVEMTNNLVYRCKSGGFHQHYGKENKIENNIFAFGYYYQAQFTRVEQHTSFSFKHNIIIQDKGETLAGPWDKGKIDIDYNLYWHLEGKANARFAGKHFDEWKKTIEPHAVYADPLFKNLLLDDYTLMSHKNINKIRFKPFDYSKAGVYGNSEWVEKAQLSQEKIEMFNYVASVRLKK